MAGKPDAWMPFYWGDYLRDTGHLDVIAHGAYVLLIGHYWTTGPLTTDDKTLRRISRCSSRQWSSVRNTVMAFFNEVDGQWRHDRIDGELNKVAASIEARSAAGRAGAAARWDGKRNATALPTHSESNASHSQNHSHKEDGDESGPPHALGRQVLDIIGALNDPSCRLDYSRVSAWLSGGATPEEIIETVTRVAARKTDGLPSSLKYFDKAIARTVQDRLDPLPPAENPDGKKPRDNAATRALLRA